MLKVLYLVHNLDDPAVRRRVLMLKAGGAKVTLAGFRRGTGPDEPIDGQRPIELGRSFDGRFGQRIKAVLTAALSLHRRLNRRDRPDLILARNLEMLALASRARSAFGGPAVPIVYECLDIHRLQLRRDAVGRFLRQFERLLLRQTSLLVTSSRAFIENYFAAYGQGSMPVLLLENRHLELADPPSRETLTAPAAGPPWRIGWFGALRCRRSLRTLSEFAAAEDGRFEIVLRGKPALKEFDDFHGEAEQARHLSFRGAYRNPEDIAAIYGEAHFSWLIDFFEDGQNSAWLLPNRLYEGSRFGAVPIALAGTETARFLERLNIGLILDEATPASLTRALSSLSSAQYQDMRAALMSLPRQTWICGPAECRQFVETLQRTATRHVRPLSILEQEAPAPE